MIRIAAIILFLFASKDGFSSPFKEPQCLTKNIDFWYDIYTKFYEEDAFIIDASASDIVILKRIKIPSDEKLRRNFLINTKKFYKNRSQKIRVITGIRSSFQEGLERDAKYRKDVEAQIVKLGLPIELSALPHVESGYQPKARSKVGAVGLWQVMPSTARLYGFNPRNLLSPSYNARVGLAVLLDAFNRLKSWPLAITAYNHGVNGVTRAVRETGSTDICTIMSEYDGPRFGVSSRNFYASFLAVLRILKDEGILDE